MEHLQALDDAQDEILVVTNADNSKNGKLMRVAVGDLGGESWSSLLIALCFSKNALHFAQTRLAG